MNDQKKFKKPFKEKKKASKKVAPYQSKKDQKWYFASCPTGMEELIQEELKEYGASGFQEFTGGIRFQAKSWNLVEFILNTRLASRVFQEIHQYKFFNDEDHFSMAKDKWWHHIFELNQTFKISTLFDKDASKFFKNSMVQSLRLKDAIVDSFRENVGARPNISKDSPDISILQRIEGIEGQKGWYNRIYLDLCGNPLSNRGYRPRGHEAPLRENLAAAMIQSSDWNSQEDIFIDPMCGSGTLLIEALYQAAKLPGSWLKLNALSSGSTVYDFQNHLWFRKENLDQKLIDYANFLLKEGQARVDELPAGQFFGNDLSDKSLNIARSSLRYALFPDDLVELTQGDATKLMPFEEAPGIVMTNPPYGERIGQETDLVALYHDLGENFKANYKGYRCYLLTSEPELRKAISLQTSMRKVFFNGGIECRMLKYEIR
ncbi:class I SAM-dependent RNA methyltransferase [Halobacteriovorax sp. HLS]|uniref:THUMP domain-containing class I SAM-dependent RNA methyltransferase n=1 Tax=Halobacteriovorax sp. HLS TaxID=2234000 RepID=UPI000FD7AB2B|nr:hypothetical protein [Halobacteriovorax sp. HLS]